MTFILSIMVLSSFALLAGAIFLGRRDGWSIKPVLMMVLAVVILGNAALLSIPNERGLAPAEADFKN
ncbi:hypothetical protein ACR9YC_04490 [Parasphingorhabdus sp. DH2-15]|uniref:hypothetical protein n=1 Tax=Parasphingorhabdus sp. DH2-15 TaxID=3444112 RepID=UPI003F682E85